MVWKADWFGLWHSLAIPEVSIKSKQSADQLFQSNIRRANDLVRLNGKGSALQSLGSHGIHINDEKTLDELKKKYPLADSIGLSDNNFDNVQATLNDFIAVIHSFNNGSAPGPSGFSSDVLKQLCGPKNRSNNPFTTSLLEIINIPLRQNPHFFAEILLRCKLNRSYKA